VKGLAISACLLFMGSCAALGHQKVDHLATAQIASDFNSYTLHRVGLLPIVGRELGPEHAKLLQGALYTELSLQTPFEIVPLSERDLEHMLPMDGFIRGRYDPAMVIELARRFRFDAMLIGTVVDYSFYSPLRLSLQMDMVATETGASIWSSSVQLDANSMRVKNAVEAYHRSSAGIEAEDGNGWELSLLSPKLFAQFGAWQIASML
jgi:hypothetical protein